MASQKVIKCKSCGAEIPKSAKACPSCGAINKQPFYKKVWFWVLIGFIVIAGVGGNSDDEMNSNAGVLDKTQSQVSTDVPKATEPAIVYESVTASDMVELLNTNALKAKETYKGKYLEITGRLSNIDSDGKYIDVIPANEEFSLTGIQCYIQNKEQVDVVMELTVDDIITVKGKITGVGEVLGYWMDVDEIQK